MIEEYGKILIQLSQLIVTITSLLIAYRKLKANYNKQASIDRESKEKYEKKIEETNKTFRDNILDQVQRNIVGLTDKVEIYIKETKRQKNKNSDTVGLIGEIKDTVIGIKEYVDDQKKAKSFESQLRRNAINLINVIPFKIEKRRQFLYEYLMRFSRIAAAILDCGWGNINYDTIEESFDGEERRTLAIFDSKLLKTRNEYIKDIILTNKVKYVIQIEKIIVELRNGDRLPRFKEISEEFISNVVDDVKGLEKLKPKEIIPN